MNKIFEAERWQALFPWTARIALFVIYFWFGLLKLIGLSPAGPLVEQLFHATISFMSFETFYVLFALFEMLIGLLFLFPRAIKFATSLFGLHMITTFMPLVFLSAITWQQAFVPTLEGQYIIKNLALIGCVVGLLAYGSKSKTA